MKCPSCNGTLYFDIKTQKLKCRHCSNVYEVDAYDRDNDAEEMIIEGVEEKWQYERLCELGADTIQGYYFSKPIPPGEAIEFKVK